MKAVLKTLAPEQAKSQCLILPVFETGKLSLAATAVDKACKGLIRKLVKRQDITGKPGQSLLIPHQENIPAERILLIGCGKKGNLASNQFQTVIYKICQQVKLIKADNICLCLDDITIKNQSKEWMLEQATQQLNISTYQFLQLKSSRGKPPVLKSVTFATQKKLVTKQKQAINKGHAVAEGMKIAKNLGNLPGNVCTPSYLASEARKLGNKHNKLTIKVLSEKQMKALKMGALLSVTGGTTQPAKLIVMEYKGGPAKQPPYALVGKGITFDSGGISLKPSAAMDEMKFDMCGAASVFGVLTTVLLLKLPINLVCVIAAAENMPSGNATKPGDIIKAMNGKTIEILNTDAEGRLVLCDALTYVHRYKPKTVIDIATLTGACVVALGNHAHGLYSNDQKLASQLIEAGKSINDRAWEMPLWPEYDKQLKSNFADIANIGGGNAGSITAACFLSRFTTNQKWAHLDIAGTAWRSGANKGATGRPVPLLSQYLFKEAGMD